MCKIFSLMMLSVGLVALSGCGESKDSLMKQTIADMNEMADAIEADKPQAELDAITKRMEEVGEKFKEFSAEEKKELAEKYADEMAAAQKRLMEAMMAKVGKAGQEMMKNMSDMPKMPDGAFQMPQP